MDRYSYFSPNIINGEELRGACDFALKLAVEHGLGLMVYVNSTRDCGQFLKKIFDNKSVNKLEAYKSIFDKSTSIQLKSPRGIKNFNSYGVILAIHTSPEALNKIEENIEYHSLVVIAEVPSDGTCSHLESWSKENDVVNLQPE